MRWMVTSFGLISVVILSTYITWQEPTTGDWKKVKHQVTEVLHKQNGPFPVEVAVAIHPNNPKWFLGCSLPTTGKGSTLYTSKDAGITWTNQLAPYLSPRMEGDGVVTFGPEGNAYLVYISFTGIRAKRPAKALNGIFVARSTDGSTWEAGVPVVDHINTVEPFEDKPGIITDRVTDSKHKGNLYVTWTRFDVYGSKKNEDKSNIYISRSSDQGKSFSPAWKINDEPGGCVDDSNTVEGAVTAIGPAGEVYVVWGGPLGLVFDKSTDGGVTFGKDTIIDPHYKWDFAVSGLGRANGMPSIAVDHSSGPNKGTLYVSWIDDRNGDTDVFMSSSKDAGVTWTKPMRVNNDPMKNGKSQFFPWMAVDPADGSINLCFFDRRNSKTTETAVTLARSVDGGKTFTNFRIDHPEFPCPGGAFFGDYIGCDASNGTVVIFFPAFVNKKEISLNSATFQFKLNSQDVK